MTIVAPDGTSRKNENVIPKSTDRSATTPPIIIAGLKPFASCKAVTAGRISSADTNITPTILTDNTTVTAVSNVRSVLMKFVFTPVVFAYSSSNVAENKSQ